MSGRSDKISTKDKSLGSDFTPDLMPWKALACNKQIRVRQLSCGVSWPKIRNLQLGSRRPLRPEVVD